MFIFFSIFLITSEPLNNLGAKVYSVVRSIISQRVNRECLKITLQIETEIKA